VFGRPPPRRALRLSSEAALRELGETFELADASRPSNWGEGRPVTDDVAARFVRASERSTRHVALRERMMVQALQASPPPGAFSPSSRAGPPSSAAGGQAISALPGMAGGSGSETLLYIDGVVAHDPAFPDGVGPRGGHDPDGIGAVPLGFDPFGGRAPPGGWLPGSGPPDAANPRSWNATYNLLLPGNNPIRRYESAAQAQGYPTEHYAEDHNGQDH